MGVKQSKRSVDITETSTKGEIEGFGNDGKVEKIIDGVVEKVAANGHVDGDLQNGIEPAQNGVEPIQNGEAAATAVTEKISEIKSVDESPVEGVVNGVVEANGEANVEAEKSEEGKKTDDKKDKKKDNKTKLIKKKFSFKTLSFSKKDKSKPLKEEKSAGKVDETETEEALANAEKEIPQPVPEELVDTTKPEEQPTQPMAADVSISNETFTVATVQIKSEAETPATGKTVEKSSTMAEDLPPPLPASPPPSEPVEGKIAADKLDLSGSASANSSGEIQEVGSSLSNILSENVDMSKEVIQNAEQIAMETGKQIEEKATNLLKTVEESMRGVGEAMSQTTINIKDGHTEAGVVEDMKMTEETKEAAAGVVEVAKKADETVAAGIPVKASTLSEKVEEPIEKDDEGAGESLADMPKELTEEATAASIEVSDPDSLEVSESIPLPPPPVVEPVTGQ